MSTTLSKLAAAFSGFGAGVQDPSAGLRMLQQQQQLRQQEELQNRQLQERQNALRVLSQQSIPEFARAGGAMPMTPEQIRQTQAKQLLAQATPAAQEVLTQLAPQPITPLQERELGLQERRVAAQERQLTTQEKQQQRQQKLAERKQALQERQFELDARKFDRDLTKGGLSDEDVFKRSTKLRGEFTKLSGDFIKQRDAFNRIQASAADPSAAGDLALIFNYMKLLDPGSVVRESEFATAQNAAGVPDRVRAVYNNVLRGEKLADKQRNDFTNRAGRLFEGASKQHNKRVGTYTNLAQKVGADPQQVIVDLGLAERTVEAEPSQDLQSMSTEELLRMLNAQ